MIKLQSLNRSYSNPNQDFQMAKVAGLWRFVTYTKEFEQKVATVTNQQNSADQLTFQTLPEVRAFLQLCFPQSTRSKLSLEQKWQSVDGTVVVRYSNLGKGKLNWYAEITKSHPLYQYVDIVETGIINAYGRTRLECLQDLQRGVTNNLYIYSSLWHSLKHFLRTGNISKLEYRYDPFKGENVLFGLAKTSR